MTAPTFVQTDFQAVWDTCQQELQDLRQKLLLSVQEARYKQLELERTQAEVAFWKRSCEASGRDLQKALLRLQQLGEVPIA